MTVTGGEKLVDIAKRILNEHGIPESAFTLIGNSSDGGVYVMFPVYPIGSEQPNAGTIMKIRREFKSETNHELSII